MTKRPTVVLIHGVFGFRKLLWIEYFAGVRALFESMGLRVVTPSLPWAGSLTARSHALAELLKDETGPLHLVAHSMGGLDARSWITHLGGADKTASLTTLATPHRGSAAADYTSTRLSPFRLFAGTRELTMENIAQFNRRTPDQAGICYRSYSATRPLAEQPWWVRRYGRVIQEAEGDNDSQVSITSASWGEHIATLPCDHFELICKNLWFNPFQSRKSYDPLPIYRDIGEWILQQEK